MRPEDELGVLIESGLSDWQILQQDESGHAALQLRGRWVYPEAFKKAVVYVRLVREASGEALSLECDWRRALTRKNAPAANGPWPPTRSTMRRIRFIRPTGFTAIPPTVPGCTLPNC